MRKPAIFKGLRDDKKAKDITLDIEKNIQPGREKLQQIKSEPADSNWPEVLTALQKGSRNTLKVDGNDLTLNGIEKVLWKDGNVTKADLINYYIQVAPHILPYLKNRPLSLYLKNNGIGAPGLYLKDTESHAPDFAKLFTTERKHKKAGKRDKIDYLICNNTATLIYLINLGCIDINPWNSRLPTPFNPDYLVIDLDPTNSPFEQVVETAKATKKVLDKLRLTAFLKTSGKTGIHIYLPCETAFSYPQARRITSRLCEMVHQIIPDITTIDDTIAKRGTKVFLDDNQNDEADTLASAYSVRPNHSPTVSAPLDWTEIKKKLTPEQFTLRNILQRIDKKGDLFNGIFELKERIRRY